jgi:hypothetical protein
MISPPESITAWREVQEHDRRRFEAGDPIAFADGGPDGREWWGGPWAAEGRLHRPARIPRDGGGTRLLAVLDPAVHARYRELVARLAPAVDRSLGPEVGAARCLPRQGGLVLEPWRTAWRRHRWAVGALARRSGPALRVDVRDFFGSVELDPLCDALTRAGAGRGDVESLRALLHRFAADGIRGLPVGPEPSAVLANLALAEADRALTRLGLPFVRWCDDVTIGLGRTAPGDAVEAWAGALRPRGLHPAPEKTRLIEPGEQPAASWGGRVSAGTPAEKAGGTASRRPSSPPPPPAGLLERAAALRDEPDPHVARSVVAGLATTGGGSARLALRHVLQRFPEHASVARWGLSR